MADTPPSLCDDASTSAGSLGEIARYFLLLGFTAFGGPAAHISMMEQDLVHRRRWLDRQHFLDLLAAINFIPGPNSTELAIALGRLRGGWRGMLVAGLCFILPAVLIILPIAWLYVNYHQLPQVDGILRGVGAAVVAIIAAAAWQLAKSAVKNPFGITVTILAAMGEWLNHQQRWAFGDLGILALAALAGLLRTNWPWPKNSIARSIALPPLGALAAITVGGPVLMVLLFLKIGATLFGSGYVLVTYVQTSFVDQRHWLTTQQTLDAVAVGQITPGPLLTTATFVGFVLGHHPFGGGWAMETGCALAATAAIFAPAFILIAAIGSSIDRLRHSPPARAALDSMNAAVVGLIAATCIFMARQAIQPPHAWTSIAIMAATLWAILALNVNTTWLIAAAAGIGLIFLR
ncbi:MAG: chromate efflux transporter [Tepidisphaeraceae bacterium]